jgi:flagellar motor switch protein FliG
MKDRADNKDTKKLTKKTSGSFTDKLTDKLTEKPVAKSTLIKRPLVNRGIEAPVKNAYIKAYMKQQTESKNQTPKTVSAEKITVEKVVEKSGSRKAAEFLILIGKEDAAKVLKHLSEDEVNGITKEIAKISFIKDKEAKHILEEFGYLIKTKDLVARGGNEKAKEMLVTAFGADKGTAIFSRIEKRTLPHPFSFLKDLEVDQVVTLLKDESPRVISVVLAHLEHSLAARILSSLSVENQKDVAKRIATIQKIAPEIIQTIEANLRERVRLQGKVVTQEVNGRAALLAIMKHFDVSQERQLIEELEKNDTDLAESLRKSLFTFEVVQRIRDKDVQKLLQNYNEKELALILKGKSEEHKKYIYKNVSQRRRELIQFEYENWGEVLKSEVDKATVDFLNYIRKEAEQGAIHILDKNEDYVS